MFLPKTDSQQDFNQTEFRAEKSTTDAPILCVGFNRYIPEDVELVAPAETSQPHVYSCQNSVALYSVNQKIRGRHFDEPVISNVKFIDPVEETPGETINSTYLPNWALFDMLGEMLIGNITYALFPDSDTKSYIVESSKFFFMDGNTNMMQVA